MIKIIISGSGSRGNCTALRDTKTGKIIIMDCGVSPPPNIKYEDVLGVFITHNHSDHIHNLKDVRGKPVYGSEGELNIPKIRSALGNYENVTFVNTNQEYTLGPFTVTPYPAKHDTDAPVHYMITTNEDSVWYGCDSYDYSDDEIEAAMKCNKIMVDCNYDEEMMFSGKVYHKAYPESLKDRIVNNGHASNQYIYDRFKAVKKKLILCHMSRNYNCEEAVRKVFGKGVRLVDDDLCPGTLKDVSKRL